MNEEELKNEIAFTEAKIMKQKINDLDERIQAMGVKLPETLLKKIQKKTGLKVHKKRFFHSNQKIAIFFLVFFLTGVCICIVKPEVIFAIKNVWFTISTQETENSVNIEINEVSEDEREFYLSIMPNGFEITNYFSKWNLKRLTFRNEKQNQYITITFYSTEYKLSLDNENYEDYINIMIGDSNGKFVEKNKIATIVFLYNS